MKKRSGLMIFFLLLLALTMPFSAHARPDEPVETRVTYVFRIGQKISRAQARAMEKNYAVWQNWPSNSTIAAWLSSPSHPPKEPWKSLAKLNEVEVGVRKKERIQLKLNGQHLTWLPVRRKITFHQIIAGKPTGTIGLVITSSRPLKIVITSIK